MSICKKALFVWIVIITLVFILFGEENDEAKKLCEKYLIASGGSALSDIKTEIRKGTLLRGVTGKVPFKMIAKAPGKWLYLQTFAWGDRVCYGFDGQTAWIQDTREIIPMNPRQRLDFQLLLDVHAPLNIQHIFPRMTVQGSGNVGGEEMIMVLAVSRDGIQTELAFDKQTGLLLKAGEMLFEDYRDVGLVKRPFKIILGKNEEEEHKRMVLEFSEIQHNEKVDDSLFQQPEYPLTYDKAPLFKRRTPVEVSPEDLQACVGTYRHPNSSKVIFTVIRQDNHLLFSHPAWGGQKFEIIPESNEDYFIEFLNLEFHFVKDPSGKVTHLEIKTDKTLKAEKIDGETSPEIQP
ncbi:MAG: DUF3471 domain-containing protein [Candidatus Aminicenantes bacterium]|nr:DUF3471 domain-containing protein [Candidatus Aminicenantes bacterium]